MYTTVTHMYIYLRCYNFVKIHFHASSCTLFKRTTNQLHLFQPICITWNYSSPTLILKSMYIVPSVPGQKTIQFIYYHSICVLLCVYAVNSIVSMLYVYVIEKYNRTTMLRAFSENSITLLGARREQERDRERERTNDIQNANEENLIFHLYKI